MLRMLCGFKAMRFCHVDYHYSEWEKEICMKNRHEEEERETERERERERERGMITSGTKFM